ncbi:MAG: hypothetical protein ABSB13_03805 [Candidatus Binatus sp.]
MKRQVFQGIERDHVRSYSTYSGKWAHRRAKADAGAWTGFLP